MAVRNRHALLSALTVALILAIAAFMIYFPGRQSSLALSLATGFGVPSLQSRVDQLEAKAIAHKPFDPEEREFLRDLYASMAKGGKLTYVLRRTGQMMEHYLSGTGAPLRIAPDIFLTNTRVTERVEGLRVQLLKDIRAGRGPKEEYATESFYMPHRSSLDSVFGLYYGRVLLRPRVTDGGEILLNWRAEVPWVWPSYESLFAKYGDYHAECVPVPNLMAVILGKGRALKIDNGLGEYLTRLGLAKSFLAFAEWQERIRTVE